MNASLNQILFILALFIVALIIWISINAVEGYFRKMFRKLKGGRTK